MADEEKPPEQGNQSGTPPPEELKPQDEETQSALEQQPAIVTQAAKRRHAAYKPSHKATFIGMAVVAVILAVNAGVLWFILRGQEDTAKKASQSVTLSATNLSKLGVSRNDVGTEGVQLTINPDAKFGGKVTIAGDETIGGQLNLNGSFTAGSGTFAKLQGGETSLQKLDVTGDATVSALNLRKDLTVAGASHLQGQVTVNQLLTVNNNLSVSGTLSVGGTLGAEFLSIKDLTITRHLKIQGSRPSVSEGGALGSNGTVSISGNDTAGTVAINVGTGAVAGTVANVTFSTSYTTTPHVLVTAEGRSAGAFYVNRTSAGFSIVVPSALGTGGYSFDYFVVQ